MYEGLPQVVTTHNCTIPNADGIIAIVRDLLFYLCYVLWLWVCNVWAFVCVCMARRLGDWSGNKRLIPCKATFALLFPWARNFTHIASFYLADLVLTREAAHPAITSMVSGNNWGSRCPCLTNGWGTLGAYSPWSMAQPHLQDTSLLPGVSTSMVHTTCLLHRHPSLSGSACLWDSRWRFCSALLCACVVCDVCVRACV